MHRLHVSTDVSVVYADCWHDFSDVVRTVCIAQGGGKLLSVSIKNNQGLAFQHILAKKKKSTKSIRNGKVQIQYHLHNDSGKIIDSNFTDLWTIHKLAFFIISASVISYFVRMQTWWIDILEGHVK